MCISNGPWSLTRVASVVGLGKGKGFSLQLCGAAANQVMGSLREGSDFQGWAWKPEFSVWSAPSVFRESQPGLD